MKFIKYLLLSCFLLSNTAYAAQKTGKAAIKTSSISGQVFIVTKGAENIKLALVEVSAIPEREMLQHVNATQDVKKKLLNEVLLARKEASVARDALTTVTMKWAKKLQEGGYVNRDSYDEEIDPVKQRYAEASTAEDAAMQKYTNGAYYFSRLPAGISISKTDADGKFKLDLPAGKYALAAKSSRHVSDETEEYYWLVWINTSSSNQSIMLSNDNLVKTGCTDCVDPE